MITAKRVFIEDLVRANFPETIIAKNSFRSTGIRSTTGLFKNHLCRSCGRISQKTLESPVAARYNKEK